MVNSVREKDEGSNSPDPKRQKISSPQTKKGEEPAVLLCTVKEEYEEEEDEENNEEGEREEEEDEKNEGGGESEEEEEENEEVEEEEGGEEGHQEEHTEASGVQMLENAEEERSISVTLTDPEVLDCPICFEPLTIPVFQCANGHIACSTCCAKIKNSCPSCSSPVGSNRCRAIEKVLESITVSCNNRKYGCTVSPLYNARRKHEKVCYYTPCFCPFPECSFKGSWKQLSDHISHIHSNSAKRFIYQEPISFNLGADQRFVVFQEEGDGFLFILNNVKVPLGNVVYVSRIGPLRSKRYRYKIVARLALRSLRLKSLTNNIQKWDETLPSDDFLLVTKQFFDNLMGCKMELIIPRVVGGVV